MAPPFHKEVYIVAHKKYDYSIQFANTLGQKSSSLITAPTKWVCECPFNGKQVKEVVDAVGDEVKGSVEVKEEKVKEEGVENIGILEEEGVKEMDVKDREVVGKKRHEEVGGMRGWPRG